MMGNQLNTGVRVGIVWPAVRSGVTLLFANNTAGIATNNKLNIEIDSRLRLIKTRLLILSS